MVVFENLKHPLINIISDICKTEKIEVVDASSRGGLQNVLTSKRVVPQTVIFCPPENCEAKALDASSNNDEYIAYCESIQSGSVQFLDNCSVAIRSMLKANTGQILFIGIDDLASGILSLPVTSIGNQLRISALKSLAKEYARMNIVFNSIICQPAKETVSPEVWKKQRGALKVFTMRFSPIEIQKYARFCADVIIKGIPSNGGVVYLGSGVTETVP